MDLDYIRIAELVELYIKDEIASEEREELALWQQKYPQIDEWLEEQGGKTVEVRERLNNYKSKNLLSDWKRVQSKVDSQKKLKINWMVAASVVAILFLGVWQLRKSESPSASIVAKNNESQVVPGTEKAYLTLADGSIVHLGEDGTLSLREKEMELIINNNSLDYSAVSAKEVFTHRLNVPIGGTYHIQLNDGTKVWLNADSELVFPSAFTGDERLISVKGEAFFEVAKDPSKAFIVEVNGTRIEALGTAFNINSHLKEGLVKTILTEGKLKVSVGSKSSIIEEGYATMSTAENIMVQKADMEEALAWKEGYFYFKNKGLEEILGEISRWYDVKLELGVLMNADTYEGGIKRSVSIESVCEILEDLTGYQVEMNNRVLTVKKRRMKDV